MPRPLPPLTIAPPRHHGRDRPELQLNWAVVAAVAFCCAVWAAALLIASRVVI